MNVHVHVYCVLHRYLGIILLVVYIAIGFFELFFLYFVRVVRGTCTHAPGSTQVQAFLLSSI